MLSDDVYTQLAIGHAREAGMEDAKSSLDATFQQGERSGARKQSTRIGLQQIAAARADKRSGGDWGTTSSLNGVLQVHSSEKTMRDYLVANASEADIERELLRSAPPTNPLRRATGWLSTYSNATKDEPRRLRPWDRIFEPGASNNTVKSEAAKARGVWFESKDDPNSIITLFHLKEKL